MLNESRTDIFLSKELERISNVFKAQKKAFRENEKLLSRTRSISQIESSSRETNEKIVEMHKKRIKYCLKNGFSHFL
ncbi:MAG: hypothetical protein OXL96_07855 [Candidatus Poribacteria bacterium]|nr:hypothetical protein [Candidatus Poribacteria bacterium]